MTESLDSVMLKAAIRTPEGLEAAIRMVEDAQRVFRAFEQLPPEGKRLVLDAARRALDDWSWTLRDGL